jgi:hypothetical protein
MSSANMMEGAEQSVVLVVLRFVAGRPRHALAISPAESVQSEQCDAAVPELERQATLSACGGLTVTRSTCLP